MKICFLAHNIKRNNGGGVLVSHVIEGIRQEFSAEIVAFTTEGGSGVSYEMPILYPQKLSLLWKFFYIRNIFKNCDAIHAFDIYPYGVIAVLYSLGLRKKILITAVGSGSIIPLYSALLSFVVKFCYRRVSYVVAISGYTKKEILRKMPRLAVQVINPGIDLAEFESAKTVSLPEYVRAYQPYIVSVGALRWRKGFKQSIRAFAEVSRRFPELRYIIVGKKYTDIYIQRLRDIIAELHLEKKIVLLENVENRGEVLQYYRGAELFCLLSQNTGHDVEGFGIVFLEAATFGLPVVGSRDTGVEDAMQSGKNGFLVDSRDSYEFAQAIIRILENKELKKRMSEESLQFARESTWGVRLAEYAALYSEVLKNLPNGGDLKRSL